MAIWADRLNAGDALIGTKPLALEFRTNVLSKIHANLYGIKTDLMFLGAEVKQLISIYKEYLKDRENSAQQVGGNHSLIDNARLLLARLEKGAQNWNNDGAQIALCYDLITTIESIVQKLENPQESFDTTALPLEKVAVVDPYRKLQGEKLPYKINRRKKEADWGELSPLPAAQLKIISFSSSPNSVEEDLEDK